MDKAVASKRKQSFIYCILMDFLESSAQWLDYDINSNNNNSFTGVYVNFQLKFHLSLVVFIRK